MTDDPGLEWTQWAACRDLPTFTFFVDRGSDAQLARNVCAACPVRSSCLAHALEHGEDSGVWGGFTSRELRYIRQTLGLTDGADGG